METVHAHSQRQFSVSISHPLIGTRALQVRRIVVTGYSLVAALFISSCSRGGVNEGLSSRAFLARENIFLLFSASYFEPEMF